jgi:hypothetical protein
VQPYRNTASWLSRRAADSGKCIALAAACRDGRAVTAGSPSAGKSNDASEVVTAAVSVSAGLGAHQQPLTSKLGVNLSTFVGVPSSRWRVPSVRLNGSPLPSPVLCIAAESIDSL